MSNDTAIEQWYDVSRVADWLLVGGEIGSAEHIAWLAGQGVTTVINAACEVSDRKHCEQHQLGYYHMYWYDDQQHKPSSQFLHVLGWMGDEEAKLAEAGKPLCVYVHCQMGINRGPLLATFLLAAREGLPADDAWERVRTSRPIATAFGKTVYRDACVHALEEHRRQ
ncbi:MAG TPA: dual specificity protein phosphatase [Ktedonobacterales bacterium]